jgi:hypothetical protein
MRALVDQTHVFEHSNSSSSSSISSSWVFEQQQQQAAAATNEQGYNIPIEQLTIAWHWPPNLGNLLSYRKLNHRTGLKVLSFVKT